MGSAETRTVAAPEPGPAAGGAPPSDEASWAHLALRLRVEDFVRLEAALLDDWRLDDWLALFAPDGRYLVPATDVRFADPTAAVSIVDDDVERLAGRVQRLQSRAAYREFPWSRVRHLVTDVRVVPPDGPGAVPGGPASDPGAAARRGLVGVAASFVIFRYRMHASDTFVGSYHYALEPSGSTFRVVEKVARLDMEDLGPGTVSVIL